jgi:hypothetical protein
MHEDARGVRDLKKSRIPFPIAAAIGVAIGLAIVLAVVRYLPKAKPLPSTEPRTLAGALLPEDEGALDLVVVHYVARLEPLVAAPYHDFLTTLDPSTRLIVVAPQGEVAKASDFLRRIDRTGKVAERAKILEGPAPMSVWSKDRALIAAAVPPSTRAGLLIPVPPDPHWVERANDWKTPSIIAQSMPESFYVNELPLEFDAGDFAVTGGKIIVDANLFAKNRSRGVASPAAMRELLAKLFAPHPIVMLGENDGDVPRHHLSMYMTPASGGVVLVGDPRLARSVVGDTYAPGETSPDSGDPLRADFSDAMIARYERAAKDLASAGFRVVRVATVAFDDKTYFAYTNGVYETRAGKKIAWVPQYRAGDDDPVAKLDAAAKKAYEDLGWETREVAVRMAYPFHGTIGCLANVLARK